MPQSYPSAVDPMNAELGAADPGLVGNDALLAAVFSGSGDCIKILDLDGRLQFMSEGGKRVMEVDDFSVLKGCPWPDFWEGTGNQAAQQAIVDARAGKPARFLGAAKTVKGTPKYWDVQVLPIIGPDGQPTHLLSISQDITELKTADDTIDRLRGEAIAAAELEAQKLTRLLKLAPSFMCVFSGPDHVFELANDAFRRLVGSRDLLGLTARQALPELENVRTVAVLDEVFRSGEPYHGQGVPVSVQPATDGLAGERYVDFVCQPIFDEAGTVTGLFLQGTDVTHQRLAARALQESELRVKLAISAAELGVWQCTVIEGRFVDLQWDERARRLLGGKDDQAAKFENFVARIHPDERAAIIPAARAALDAAGDGVLDLEYRVLGFEDSQDHWVHARAQAVHGPDGVRLIGTVRDISSRKDFEARQQMLSAELEHRIKNTLAMVSAIASQTFRGADIAERRANFSARLDALARAHSMLIGQTWTKTSIYEVVEAALVPHRAGADSFKLSGPALELTSKQGLSLALTIHELATNAAKYGALSVDDGEIDLSWSTDKVDKAGLPVFSFTWAEHGGPKVQQPERTGFGTRLITRVLASDFDGVVRIEYDPSGVVCTLVSPLASVTAGDALQPALLSDQVTH